MSYILSNNESLTPHSLPGLLTPSAETQTNQQEEKRPLPRRALLVGAIALLAGGGAITYTLLQAGQIRMQDALSEQRTKLQAGQTPAQQSSHNTPSSSTTSTSISTHSTSSRSPSGTTVQKRPTADSQSASTAGSPAQSPVNTPNPAATQAPVAPPLTLKITGIPSQVYNNTDVPITITANTKGVEVHLIITYNLLSDIFNSTSQTTSSNGQAMLNWHVDLLATVTGLIAHVTAVAKDQNGQQVKSPVASVMVLSSLLG